MIIKTFAEINYKKEFFFNEEQIENIASKLLENAISKKLSSDYSSDNDYEFEILISDNTFIQEINKTYRDKDKATDVITFALYADSENKMILDNIISLGQIIISADKVFEQANDNNLSPQKEFLNLLSHGLLHLLGFTHEDDESLIKMLDLQNILIEELDNVKI